MHYIYIILFIVFLHTLVDAFIIEILKKKPNHTMELLIFAFVVLIPSILLWQNETILQRTIFCAATTLLCRAGLYDFLLNYFRGLPITYISPNATDSVFSKDESFFDWLENYLKLNENHVRLGSLILYIAWIIYWKKIVELL
jgi:hypothetical protein